METPILEYPKEESQKSVDEKSESNKSLIDEIITGLLMELRNLFYPDYNRAKLDLEVKYQKWSLFTYPKVFLVFFLLFLAGHKSDEDSIVVMVAGATTFSIILTSFHRYLWEIGKKDRQRIVAEHDIAVAKEKAEENLFKNSIQTSYKYLDRYYDQTQRQAQQGFHITVFIAVCGALLIFGGVAAMYLGFVQPAYITCASGAITELISAIFFYLYNKTVTSMSRYHNKLVLSQNISFALRVADSLSEEKKDDAKLAIINELVKDVNAQMMKSDADTDEPPKKDKPSDNETPS